MLSFTTFVLWVHLAAAAIWVGGIFAVSFVSVPVLRRDTDSTEDSARLIRGILGRFQRISREVLTVILITGAFNLMNAGMARGWSFSGSYLALLATKVLLFLVMAGIQLWQTYRLVPALNGPAAGPDNPVLRRFYRAAALNVVLATAVILIGLELRYGR